MGWRCIKTGQAPNSKVARTPTLPIPPISTLGCILLHCIELACTALSWPAVCCSGVKCNQLNLNGEKTPSQMYFSTAFLNCTYQLYVSTVMPPVYFWVGSVGARSAIRWTRLGRERSPWHWSSHWLLLQARSAPSLQLAATQIFCTPMSSTPIKTTRRENRPQFLVPL